MKEKLSPIEEILTHLTITASDTSLIVSKVTWLELMMRMVRMMVSKATKYIALMMEEKHREIIKARWTHLKLIIIKVMIILII